MGDIRTGCSLVVTMVRVYQFLFNCIITGYFCTPQKASVGMYSRYDYLLFVYFLILPSLLHSSILFNCFYTCFCSFLLHLSMPSYMVCSQLLIKWKMAGAKSSLPRPSLTCVHNNIIMTMNRMTKKAALCSPSSDETFPLREKNQILS